MIIDTHCHLDLLCDRNISEIIDISLKNGVTQIITVCTKVENIDNIVNIANSFSNIVFPSFGHHPCNVDSFQENVDSMMRIVEKYKNIIAIGETGLDYFHSQDNKHIEKQRQSFEIQINIASKTNLPLIIHSRNAENDTYEMLKYSLKNKNIYGVIHCFSGNYDFMKKMIDIGFYISLSGIVTFKNAISLQEIAKAIPIDRLLIETDSPYLAPIPHRGKINEPSFTRHIAEFLSCHLNIGFDKLVNILFENTNRLFNLNQKL